MDSYQALKPGLFHSLTVFPNSCDILEGSRMKDITMRQSSSCSGGPKKQKSGGGIP